MTPVTEAPRPRLSLTMAVVATVLIAAAIMPIGIVGTWLAYDAREEALQQRAGSLTNIAIMASGHFEALLRTVEVTLAIDRADLAVGATDQARCNEVLAREIASHPFVLAAIALTADLVVVCASNRIGIGQDLSDRPYLREALSAIGFVVGEPVFARPGGQLVLPVAERLRNAPVIPSEAEANAPHIVAAALDLNRFVRESVATVNAQGVGFAGQVNIWVVDNAGRVLADSLSTETRGRMAPFAAQLSSTRVRTTQGPGFDGEDLLLAAGPVLPGGVRIIVGQPRDVVTAGPDRRLVTSVSFALFSLLLGLTTAAYIAKRIITDPLHRLTQAAQALERGETRGLSGRPLMVRELDQLRESFDRMSRAIDRRETRLISNNAYLMELAHRDGLTGVLNRRALDQALEDVWLAALARSEPVSAIFLDVDYFKSYNDMYGHQAGDDVLRNVANILMSLPLRGPDLVARYGGEEFVVLLPATDAPGAEVVAERSRKAILQAGMPHAGSPVGVISVSIGVATLRPASGMSPLDLLRMADAAVYEAKRAGRNRVCTSMSSQGQAA